MSLSLYMDQHIPKAITVSLRLRGVNVVTAHEDGAGEFSDSELLDRARELRRVVFTQDDDLLSEAVRRQREHIGFHGVIYAQQLQVSISKCVRDLELIAKAGELEDILDQVQFLPL